MTTINKKVFKTLIPLLLAVGFGWYTFSKLPVKEFITYFENANLSYILVGVIFGILSHFSRAYRWKFMLEPIGYEPKLPNSIMAVFIAYLANFGIPRSGEILRASVLANYEGVPFEKGFGTIVAERFADLIMISGIMGVALFLEYDYIYHFLVEKFNTKKLLFLVVGLLLSILFFMYILKSSQSKLAIKVRGLLRGLFEGIFSIFRMKQRWWFIVHTFFIWLMYVLMFYVTTFAVPEIKDIPFGAVLVAFISASFTIAATNGGIFIYPLAIGAAFSLFDIPEIPSIAFGWIIWTAQTVLIIIFGCLSFLYLPIYNRANN